LNQAEDALDYYEKAIAHNANAYTTPKYLYKAGITAMNLGYTDKALEYLERIKNDFPSSNEANNIEALIGSVKK